MESGGSLQVRRPHIQTILRWWCRCSAGWRCALNATGTWSRHDGPALSALVMFQDPLDCSCVAVVNLLHSLEFIARADLLPSSVCMSWNESWTSGFARKWSKRTFTSASTVLCGGRAFMAWSGCYCMSRFVFVKCVHVMIFDLMWYTNGKGKANTFTYT